MKVGIGSDHHGMEHRLAIADAVRELGGEALDLGTDSSEPCDYPDIAFRVADAVHDGLADRGVLVCGTGIGMSIAANKVAGIRAAVCHDANTTRLSREHNDANVLCLPGKGLSLEEIRELVRIWLTTAFEGGRHARRVDKIIAREANELGRA